MAKAIQGRNGNCAWPHITGISPLRGSLRAAPFGTGVPTLVLSSQDRSATICFLVGRTRSPPSMPHLCKYLHRWIFALPPVSLPILYLYKAHQRMYFSFWIFTLQGAIEGIFRFQKKLPHYLSSFASLSGTNQQKLPIMSNNILSFDRILLRCLLTPLWVSPIRFA